MLLSRVAERIYWAARYLQRAESTARIVNVYTNLLMDLPKDINISWYNLITLNSAELEFDKRYKNRDERNVVKFNIADSSNVNSMAECLHNVRENLRTTRDVMPQNAWELINELTAFVDGSVNEGGLNRGKRHEFLSTVIDQCQMIQGYMASTLSHDEVWEMWRIGRDLERADMTTRILDAGANILKDQEYDDISQLPIVVWGNVLRSSSADHAYRHSVSASVVGKEVAKFLLTSSSFPRSVSYCVNEIIQAVNALPRGRKVSKSIKGIQFVPANDKIFDDLGESFSDYLNDLQLNIARLHGMFSDTWFAVL